MLWKIKKIIEPGKRDKEWGDKVIVLNRVVKVGLIEKETFEQRLAMEVRK